MVYDWNKHNSIRGKITRNKNIVEYDKNPNKCRECDISIGYDKRNNSFCSHSCSAVLNNKKKRKYEIRYCKICKNVLLHLRPSVYCCLKCKNDYITNKIINNEVTSHKVLRRYLIEKYGKVCSVCGIDNWLGEELIIEMDHIDGNKKNNVLSNVRLLCPNCHSQTPTWKFKKSRVAIVGTAQTP